MQIVGRRGRDFEVLQLAHAFEQATRHALRRPPLATPILEQKKARPKPGESLGETVRRKSPKLDRQYPRAEGRRL